MILLFIYQLAKQILYNSQKCTIFVDYPIIECEMMLESRIRKWAIGFRKYFFLYRNGYFELPYLSNTPQIMVNSFQNMPFTKKVPDEHIIYSDTIFTSGSMRYRELEDGLWIILSEMNFKKNVCTKALYDQEPCKYYFLSHFRYTSLIKNISINEINLPNIGWSLYKPGTEIKAFFNAGDKGSFFNFVFSEDWFKQNIVPDNLEEQNQLKEYLDSENAYMVWEDVIHNSHEIINKIVELIKEPTDTFLNKLSMKISCLEIITSFLKILSKKEKLAITGKPIFADSYLSKAEKMIINSLTSEFPGIDVIAKTVHISPTKLKNDFKKVYGHTIFGYYQVKQMSLARELLINKKYSVKEVSEILGYDNPSNFTLAFKKVNNNELPSSLK